MTRGKTRKAPKVNRPAKTSAGTDAATGIRTVGRGLARRKVNDERRAVLDDADAEHNGNGHPDVVDHTGNEVENGPEVDPSDPNLSAALVDADGGDMNEALGLRGEDTMELDDPEEMDEEGEEGEERDLDMPGVGRR